MNSWMWWSSLALVVWGIWGFLPKLATKYMAAPSIIIYEILGGMCVGLVCFYFVGLKPATHLLGILKARLAGFAGLLGGLFSILALDSG